MNSKTYYGEYSLRHWINLMLRKNIILPEYQRSFVWSVQDMERLILSFKTGQFIQPVTIARMNSLERGTNIILDGQQRLTSILLFALGLFPKKDKFRESYRTVSDDDSAEDPDNPDNSSSDTLHGNGIEWTFEEMLPKDKTTNTLDSIRYELQMNGNYDSISLKNSLSVMDENEMAKFLDNTFLGFSFIVPENTDAISEQQFFSTLFRNMNYLGRKLSTLESRKSLYYLNNDFKNYFEGKLEDGTDALAGLRIMEKVVPGNIDFVRYLSMLSQFDGKNVKNIMVGYSSFASRESYYVDYVSYLLNLEQEDRVDKFNRFDFKQTFGENGWQIRFQKLRETLQKLKRQINFDSKFPDVFRSWVDADYWLFGLIYWVVFKGIDINIDKELGKDINTRIEYKKDGYSRTPNLLKNIRERLAESVSIYKKYIV